MENMGVNESAIIVRDAESSILWRHICNLIRYLLVHLGDSCYPEIAQRTLPLSLSYVSQAPRENFR